MHEKSDTYPDMGKERGGGRRKCVEDTVVDENVPCIYLAETLRPQKLKYKISTCTQ